jgi:PadR family transcriptional regulator PadR
MRRKQGQLLPLELAICQAASALHDNDIKEFHGYEISKAIAAEADARLLTAYGTLYRALGRLEDMGLVTSRWEEAEIAARENRPGRRLYSLTGLAERAVRAAETEMPPHSTGRKRRRLAQA